MADELTMVPAAAPTMHAKQVFAMAAVCLVLGLAIGYFSRGSLSGVRVPRPISRVVSAAVPSGTMHGQRAPTLEEMKHMADKQAEAALEKLKTDPKNPVLLAQVAGAYHLAHQFKQAAVYYDKAVDLDPKNVALRSKLAASLYRSGDVDAAILQLNKGLSYEPSDANSLFNLGTIKLQGKHDGKGALAAWQKLLKLNPQLSAEKKAAVQQLIAQVMTSGVQKAEGARSDDNATKN